MAEIVALDPPNPICGERGCDHRFAHHHGVVWSPNGSSAPAIIAHSDDPYAEVRDPESGEVIFPAVKRPLRVVAGSDA